MKIPLFIALSFALWAQQSGPALSIGKVDEPPPALGACVDIVNVGSIYIQANNPSILYSGPWICLQTGARSLGQAAYSWQKLLFGSGGSGYQTIQNNGTPLTQRTILNFTTNVTCSDDSGGSRTDCSATGGSSGYYTLTPPVIGNFSWFNQGSATVSQGQNAVLLTVPAPGSGTSMSGRQIAAPSTPWSITAAFVAPIVSGGSAVSGLYVTDGTKVESIAIGIGGVDVFQWTTANSAPSGVASLGFLYLAAPVFYKVVNDGTNLTWYMSVDGGANGDGSWFKVYQEGSTSFLSSVADVGFYVGIASTVTVPFSTLLVSWSQGTN